LHTGSIHDRAELATIESSPTGSKSTPSPIIMESTAISEWNNTSSTKFNVSIHEIVTVNTVERATTPTNSMIAPKPTKTTIMGKQGSRKHHH